MNPDWYCTEWDRFDKYEEAQLYVEGISVHDDVEEDYDKYYWVSDYVIYDNEEMAHRADKYCDGRYNFLQGAIDEVKRNGHELYMPRFTGYLGYKDEDGDIVWEVYVDGACSGNGTSEAAAGYGVYFGDNNPKNVSEAVFGYTQTNQRAELSAILRAFQPIDDHHPGKYYRVYTDSAYAINCLTKWHIGWERNGWVNSRGMPVANRDLIEDIIELRSDSCRNAVLKKVTAHSGDSGNDAADKLAREGIEEGLSE